MVYLYSIGNCIEDKENSKITLPNGLCAFKADFEICLFLLFSKPNLLSFYGSVQEQVCKAFFIGHRCFTETHYNKNCL
jgi:hypothetical protein